MAAYEKLTDSIVDRIICSNDNNLEESREILMKVKIRQLYKFVGQTHPHEKMDARTVKEQYVRILEKNNTALGENDVTVDVVHLNYGMKDKNPIDHVRFYTKGHPDVAIRVKKAEVSDLLPVKFEEQRIRFYCKRDDEKCLGEAKQALTDWCKDNNCSVVSDSQIITMTPVKKKETGAKSTN